MVCPIPAMFSSRRPQKPAAVWPPMNQQRPAPPSYLPPIPGHTRLLLFHRVAALAHRHMGPARRIRTWEVSCPRPNTMRKDMLATSLSQGINLDSYSKAVLVVTMLGYTVRFLPGLQRGGVC